MFRQAPFEEDANLLMVSSQADLLLSYRCEDDLKALIPHIPRSCQSILMSATSRSNVLHVPFFFFAFTHPILLTLPNFKISLRVSFFYILNQILGTSNCDLLAVYSFFMLILLSGRLLLDLFVLYLLFVTLC